MNNKYTSNPTKILEYSLLKILLLMEEEKNYPKHLKIGSFSYILEILERATLWKFYKKDVNYPSHFAKGLCQSLKISDFLDKNLTFLWVKKES
jgi:hypothetical protein